MAVLAALASISASGSSFSTQVVNSSPRPTFLPRLIQYFLSSFLEIIVPDSSNGEVVVIPEFTFVLSAIRSNSGVFGVDWVGFTVFVEEV